MSGLVSATNKNLEEMVKTGDFAKIFYFRLKVVEISLPPLRGRTGDIPLLAQNFLREFARENEKKVNDFSTEALEAMMEYRWPGNGAVECARRSNMRWCCAGARESRCAISAGNPAQGRRPGRAGREPLLAQNTPTVQEAEKISSSGPERVERERTWQREIGISRGRCTRKLHTYHWRILSGC